jgi:hypothetical protein
MLFVMVMADDRGVVRFVRLLLSPTLEEMEARSKMAESVTGETASQEILTTQEHKILVLPTDNINEAPRFGRGSVWGAEQLRLLGVEFPIQRRIDLDEVLNVKEGEWSPEMKARMYPKIPN